MFSNHYFCLLYFISSKGGGRSTYIYLYIYTTKAQQKIENNAEQIDRKKNNYRIDKKCLHFISITPLWAAFIDDFIMIMSGLYPNEHILNFVLIKWALAKKHNNYKINIQFNHTRTVWYGMRFVVVLLFGC